MSICFIVNPTAGKGKAEQVTKDINLYMKDLGIKYEIRYTTRSKEAELMASCATKEGFQKIVSVGGDGTIYEVLNGLVGKRVTLGVIPTGTGNDFARTMGIEQNIKSALDTIVYGEEMSIDCGCANGRYFINVAGIGFDTEILREVKQIKRYLSGKWAYLAGVFKTLFKYHHKNIEIMIDNEVYIKEVLLMAFANGRYYGGGMKISPYSDLDDGYLDICIIGKISKWRILKLFPTIFSGKHVNVKEVTMHKAKQININCSIPIEINLDGDLVGTTPLSLKVIPKAIKILVPRKNLQQ